MDVRDKSGAPGKIRPRRILSIAILLVAVAALVLALKKPQPVALPQTSAAIAANAQSFQAKVNQLEQAQAQGQSGSEVRLSAEEIGAAIAQAEGAMPASPAEREEPILSFEDDIVRAQFVTDVAGQKTYITVAGRLGSKNGWVTFEPTEFKVGDLKVPVSLVNGALQKKLLEQQDRLKLPDFIGDVRVENSQLVVKAK